MTPHQQSASLVANASSREGLGITLMVIASLLVPCVDGIAKYLSVGMSPLYLAFCRYLVAACLVLPLAASKGQLRILSSFKVNVVRTLLIVGCMVSFFFAIKLIPLASAFGGFFLGPIIAAVGAAPLLGERVSTVRMLSAAAGFLGALLIVQPTIAHFEIGSVWAVTSGILFGAYLLVTRLAASATPPLTALVFQCVLGALILAPFAALNWVWPTNSELLMILVMGSISAICHFFVITAFRHAGSSVLAPLSYLELVTATVIGSFVFKQNPNVLACCGIFLIISSGLILGFYKPTKMTV